jgi:hypothetical protein
MSAAVDPVAAIRTILLADSDVAALVGTRIGDEVPASAVASMPQAAIVLNPAGGPGRPGGGYQEYGKQRIDVICYGETLGQSWRVYLAAYAALKQLQRQISEGVLVHSAEVSSKGSRGLDPTTQWPTTFSSWLVLASEITA